MYNCNLNRRYIQTVQNEERTARQHNRVSKAVDAFLKVSFKFLFLKVLLFFQIM